MKRLNKNEILKILEENNYKLIDLLQKLNIKKLNLINCGNSIASGFSSSSYTKPLLLRNESIQKIAEENGINLKRFNFSRPEDNNDERIFEWLVNDIPLSVINKLNRFDIINMNEIGVDEKAANEYYPLDDETTFNMLINNDSEDIIIYNGATGSFLDNITRHGNHYFTYGIKRDCNSIESFLKYVQTINREKNKNIQVFLCGAPKLLGITDIHISINPRLKSIAKKYANVSYVDNFDKKLLYKKPNNKLTPDLHYDEDEYLILNNKIIKTIGEQYLIKLIMIKIDRSLYKINMEYQFGKIKKEEIEVYSNNVINNIIENYNDLIREQNIDSKVLYKNIREYLLNKQHHDFYYIGKDNIKSSFKNR